MKFVYWILTFILLACNTVFADTMRPANGVACHTTEQTYFDRDGVTPWGCVPARGPAYSFTVFSGSTLIWSSTLPTDQPAVFFDISEKQQGGPRLVVKRDLAADPEGYVVFFGAVQLVGFHELKGGGSVINWPILEEVGKRFRIPRNGSVHDIQIGKIIGTTGPTANNEYSITITHE